MPTRAPVIGIAAAIEDASWGVWRTQAHLLPREYADAVSRAGAIAFLVPPGPDGGPDPDAVLDRLDGVILAGGADVDPELYGAARHPETRPGPRTRDDVECDLARAAIARDVPLLAICRGMQILNVVRGGTIEQHLPDVLGHREHLRVAGTFEGADHVVRLDAGSLAAATADEQAHHSYSHHHQAVAEIGDGLRVTGRSEIDGLVEAIEMPDRRFVLGVQWHPEVDRESGLIAAFVDACRASVAD